MTPEKLYDKWHEKLKKANEEVRLARRKYHKTKMRADEVELEVLRTEAHTIKEFLEDVRKLNPHMDSKY